MNIEIEQIKKLKAQTGVGLTDAKQALEEAGGDFDKALEAMRIKGLAKADKKAEREASEGLIHSYVHGQKIGVLVELNCETDFVAKTDEFKALANDLALHIAASAPHWIDRASVDQTELGKERQLIEAELKEQGKPADMVGKIAEGKLDKWYESVCLLEQPFVKDPDKKVGDLLKEAVAKLGENIQVGNFARLQLGQ